MDKTIKTVLAIVGVIALICGVLLLLKKKFGGCCKKCGKDPCECDKPETVEDFVEEAAEAVEKKTEEVKEVVEEAGEKAEDFVEEKVEDVKEAISEAKEKAEAIVEEFKDYADVELPND